MEVREYNIILHMETRQDEQDSEIQVKCRFLNLSYVPVAILAQAEWRPRCGTAHWRMKQAAAYPFTAGHIAVPVKQQARKLIYDSRRNGSFTAAS